MVELTFNKTSFYNFGAKGLLNCGFQLLETFSSIFYSNSILAFVDLCTSTKEYIIYVCFTQIEILNKS